MALAETLWRVFPWDQEAPPGHWFSPQFIAPAAAQGSGRFDLRDSAPVTYFAETPDHAVAELIQGFRGSTLDAADLTRYGKPLALVGAEVAGASRSGVFDLCSAPNLVDQDISPDATAARRRATTQAVAGQLHAAGFTGLRWWSAFFGEWHTVVLFRDRIAGKDLAFGTPEILGLGNAHVIEAANALDVRLSRMQLPR